MIIWVVVNFKTKGPQETVCLHPDAFCPEANCLLYVWEAKHSIWVNEKKLAQEDVSVCAGFSYHKFWTPHYLKMCAELLPILKSASWLYSSYLFLVDT